jgi:tetratricopeptide (TPR) repeat protein
LDLNSHDPEEYEGKIISYNNCEYVIGQYLSFGVDKIVHKLINRRSKLSLFVIKLWRIPDPRKIRRLQKSLLTFYGKMEMNKNAFVPGTIIVEGHKGIFELQQIVKDYDDDHNTMPLMKQADNERKQSHLDNAILLYDQVLKINELHTGALINTAYCYSKLGDTELAYNLVSKALEVEPNYLQHHVSFIVYAAELDKIWSAINQFEKMRLQHPYCHWLDELAIDLYRSSGQPEKAKKLLEENKLYVGKKISSKIWNKFSVGIDEDLNNKNSALAIYAQARDNTLYSNWEEAGRLLKQAYSIYSKDFYISFNYSLALQREGNFKDANSILASWMQKADRIGTLLCTANLAFGEMQQSHFRESVYLLDALAVVFGNNVNMIEGFSHKDLPSKAIWIDTTFQIEEPTDYVIRLFDELAYSYPDISNISKRAQNLIALYRMKYTQEQSKT